jgi:hypothetical protein
LPADDVWLWQGKADEGKGQVAIVEQGGEPKLAIWRPTIWRPSKPEEVVADLELLCKIGRKVAAEEDAPSTRAVRWASEAAKAIQTPELYMALVNVAGADNKHQFFAEFAAEYGANDWRCEPLLQR